MRTHADQNASTRANGGGINIRMPELVKRVGLSKTEIYRKIRRGEFPPPRKLGHRTAVWSVNQVDQWSMKLFDPEIEDLLG